MRLAFNWRRLLTPFRFLISGGLLVFLIWQSNPVLVWEAWKSADLRFIALAFVLQLLGVMVSAAKWNVLLHARRQGQPYIWTLGVYLAGQFANNFLPTAVGGDAVKIVQLGRRIGSFSEASASVFMERLTGFVALSLIANIALALTYTSAFGTHLATDPMLQWVTAIFALAAIATVIASFSAPRLLRMFGRRLPDVIRGPLQKIAEALAEYAPQKLVMAQVLGLSFLFHACWISSHLAVGMALGIQAPPLIYALMVPITDIVGLAPIFVNNVGARDLVFTLYLSQVGVPSALAIALAFIVFTVRLVVSSLGGLAALFGGADLKISQAETDAQTADSRRVT